MKEMTMDKTAVAKELVQIAKRLVGGNKSFNVAVSWKQVVNHTQVISVSADSDGDAVEKVQTFVEDNGSEPIKSTSHGWAKHGIVNVKQPQTEIAPTVINYHKV